MLLGNELRVDVLTKRSIGEVTQNIVAPEVITVIEKVKLNLISGMCEMSALCKQWIFPATLSLSTLFPIPN